MYTVLTLERVYSNSGVQELKYQLFTLWSD